MIKGSKGSRIQISCHSRESGNPEWNDLYESICSQRNWIPASAGMTTYG